MSTASSSAPQVLIPVQARKRLIMHGITAIAKKSLALLQVPKIISTFALPKITKDWKRPVRHIIGLFFIPLHIDFSSYIIAAVVSRKYFSVLGGFGEPGNDSRFSMFNL